MLGVEVALKAVCDIEHAREPGLLKGDPSLRRTAAAAANQHDRSIGDMCREFSDIRDKVRVQLPIGRLAPGDMDRTGGVANEKILGIAAAIDEQRIRVLTDEGMRFARKEMLHAAPTLQTAIQGPGRP